MQLKHLQSFIAVAEALHFRRAASVVGLTQPALSQHIARLELDVGAQLLIRDRRRVQLTPAGEALLCGAQAAMARLDEAALQARSLSDARKNTLVIGQVDYISHAYFPRGLKALKAAYPQAVVDARGMVPTDSIAAVRDGSIDVAFIAALEDTDPSDSLGDLVLREVIRGHWQVIVSTAHPLARLHEVPLSALTAHELILFQRRINPAGYDWFMQHCEKTGFTARVGQHVSQPQNGSAMAAQNVGAFVVRSYVSTELPPKTVAKRLVGLPSMLRVMAAWLPGTRNQLRSAFLSGFSSKS